MNYRGNDDKHNRVSRNGLCGVHEMALSVDAFADVAMRWVLLHACHPQFLVLRLRAPLGSLPSRPEIKDSGKMEITRCAPLESRTELPSTADPLVTAAARQ